jgi:hypothetical protein
VIAIQNLRCRRQPYQQLRYSSARLGQAVKLTTANYHTWKSDIEIILEGENLLEIVLGNEVPPTDGNSRAAIEATNQYQACIKKAYSIVAGSCSITVRDFFNGIRDPAAIWTTLIDTLNTASSEAGQLALARTFQSLRPRDHDTSIGQHIARLMNIRNQLAGTEEEIPEKRMVPQIYISLPSEFDSLIKVIKYGPREQQTLDNVLNTQMEEENSKNNKLVANNAGSSLTSGSALTAYSRENGRGRGGSRGRRRGCGGNRGTDYTRGSSHSYGRGGI